MNIDRTTLLISLESFARSGSGLVVGSPGSGKTYLVSELSKRLEQGGVPNLQIAVDALGGATNVEIRQALELDADLISTLESERVREGVLIVDGYDAARNQTTQRNILELLRSARQRLTAWNLIVVVRTYDAQKSSELSDLFACDSGTGSSYASIPCRHFLIPQLEQTEIQSLEEESPRLFSAYVTASDELKGLLRVPFNLWLLERMLPGSSDEIFKGVVSQVQLLRLFWQRRVVAVPNGLRREYVLVKIVEAMVSQRTLSILKAQVFEPERSQEWGDLFSNEVLIEQPFGNSVRFGHNILFDYAVSVLMLDEDANSVIRFLRDDQSRQLFLRPSFVFYFARLWHENQSVFWANYKFLLSDAGIEGRLLGRLVPPTVLVQECNSRAALDPLLQMQASAPFVGPHAALYALRSLRTWESRSLQIWVAFVNDLTAILSQEIAWEIGLFIESSLKKDDPQASLLGHAARGFVDWIWAHRKVNREFADAILGRFGVPLVAKTFASDPKASRVALEPVLRLVTEANFPIQPLYQLAANLDPIAQDAPYFVGDVYRTIFRSEELSEAKTQMGGSTVLVFTSTRRQDFEMCHYLLLEYFPKYLGIAFHAAVAAGIEVVNADVRRRHADDTADAQRFAFRGGLATYIADSSFIWDAHLDPYEPVLVLDHICSRMDEILRQSGRTPEIEDTLDLFRNHAQVAFCWKKLLGLVAKQPGLLHDVGVELCVAPCVLSGRDTIYEAGAALAALATVVSASEMRSLEEVVVALEPEALRKRLVSQIPSTMIVTPEIRRIRDELEQANQIVRNEPLVQFRSYSREYTTEDFLQDRGVDLGQPGNRKLRELSAVVTTTMGLTNKSVSAAELDAAWNAAATLWTAVKETTEADEAVKESAWIALARYARFVLTNVQDPNEPMRLMARNVIIACARHPSPTPSLDADSEFNSPAWISSPRTEAAQLLPIWFARTGEREALDVFLTLVQDPTPEVRFLSAHELWRLVERAPAEFWSAIKTRIAEEVNDVVLQGLLDSIGRVIRQHEDAGVEALSELRRRALSGTAPRELADLYSSTVMWLALVRENAQAIEFLNEILDDPIKYSKAVHRAAFDAGGWIAGKKDEGIEESAYGANAARSLIRIIGAAESGLRQLMAVGADQGKDSPLVQLYRSIDAIVTRLWVARKGIETAHAQEFYFRARPVLNRIIEFAMTPDLGSLAPSTAHHAMEFLNAFVRIDPRGVLKMAWQITSRSPGYNLDSLAIDQVVKLVEVILADHRDQMRDPESLQQLLELLDIFAETGWSEALRLVWRLDEVFR